MANRGEPWRTIALELKRDRLEKVFDMNCAYQYSLPAHPQNVVAMPPTAVQQPLHSTDTEYLEVTYDHLDSFLDTPFDLFTLD